MATNRKSNASSTEVASEETARVQKTRKPRTSSPVTTATVRHRRAVARVEKARAKAQKVADVTTELEAAEAEFAASKQELASILGL